MQRPLACLTAVACGVHVAGCAGSKPQPDGSTRVAAGRTKTFEFTVYDKTTIRSNPTTQVAIRVAEWPGQTFLLWFPEAVGDLWVQWDAAVAHQDFVPTASGGLRWVFAGDPRVHIVAELTPRDASLLLEVEVRNRSDQALENVRAQNCLHLSEAPAFACRDFTRVHLRSGGQWRCLAGLRPTVGLPMFYRPGFVESGRPDSWDGGFRSHIQDTRADHPLIACTSTDGRRTIGTVSADYECVFHNRDLPYLLCIHSQQAPVPILRPGEAATFRQVIYFIDGGIAECLRAYEKDPARGVLRAGSA